MLYPQVGFEAAIVAPSPTPTGLSTKLCTLFVDPARDWHGRRGWVVDLTYAQWADSTDDRYWSIDELAARVHAATTKGLRMLVRVDYDKGQTLPPTDDLLALEEYLAYLQRLARDERLQDVYGYIIGSGYNTFDSISHNPEHPITPAWYVRLFNGYGVDAAQQDNVVQVMRAEQPNVRILVGPIRPWVDDQAGDLGYVIDAPWLSYLHTVITLLTESAAAKSALGDGLTLPDGFALHVPGRITGENGIADALEPQRDNQPAEWDGAQAGFRVYQDFLAVINNNMQTRGLPAYISTTNTFAPDEGVTPAENYPAGWLANALAEIDTQPQIRSLCWFLDLVPGDDQWDAFSLTREPGRMRFAGDEFDQLLQKP